MAVSAAECVYITSEYYSDLDTSEHNKLLLTCSVLMPVEVRTVGRYYVGAASCIEAALKRHQLLTLST